MIRISSLRNLPIICGGQQIGILQNATFDAAQKRVCALIASCGFRGKRIIRADEVLSVTDSFILAEASKEYRRSREAASCRFVRDSTGILSGYVTDYAIDEVTLAVIAIEITQSHLPSAQKKRIWAYEYSRPSSESEELIVPSCLGSELKI